MFLAAAGSGLSAELLEDVIKYDGNVTLIRTGQGPQEFALPSASFPKVFQTFEKGRGASTKGLILGEKNLEVRIIHGHLLDSSLILNAGKGSRPNR